MSVQVVCEDCSKTEGAGTEQWTGAVRRPGDWGHVAREYAGRKGKVMHEWVDLCPDCFAKHNLEHPEDEE
jgi:hypothetical protein